MPNLIFLRLMTSESTMKTDTNTGFTKVYGLAQGNVGSLILRLILSEITALVFCFGLEQSQPPPKTDTSKMNTLSAYY